MNPFADIPPREPQPAVDDGEEGFDLLLAGYHTRTDACVEVPDGVTQILPEAFRGHAEIERIRLPESLQSVGAGAFRGCTGLREVIIPDAVFEIGERAFSGCSSLRRVRLPKGLLRLQRGTFSLCSGLEEVAGGGDVYIVEEDAFRGCSSLKGLPAFPELEAVGSLAFAGCGSLSVVELPESTRSVGSGAFRGCAALVSARLPVGVEELGRDLFSGCARLRAIEGARELAPLFPNAFPKSVVAELGMLRDQDRRHDEWAYRKLHGGQIAEARAKAAAAREELHRLEEELSETGITERARRKQLKEAIDEARSRRWELKAQVECLSNPTDEDLLEMARRTLR